MPSSDARGAAAVGRHEHLWCAATIAASLACWFSAYVLHGDTFLSEAGQMLWADWVVARKTYFAAGGVSEWNPYVLFGVDWAGREAFLNPANAGGLVGVLLPGDKVSFMAATLLFLALMGASIYAFLRGIGVRAPFARIGMVVYLLAPKWVDDGYHGPRFIVGYAVLPLTLLLIVRMHAAGFQRRMHFVLFAVLVSLTYLGLGAPFLLIQAYITAAFFAFMVYRRWREQRSADSVLVPRTIVALAACGVLIIALCAYVLFPFFANYRFAERSLYVEPTGWSGPEYLGFVFPWINRIYGRGVYDLPYPAVVALLYPNVYFYVGVLAVPVLAIAFARRLLTPIAGFFAAAFFAWLITWNHYAVAFVPLIPAFERLTHGSPSQNQGHIILIVSMSVVLSSVLQAMADRGESPSHGRGGRYLAALNWALIGAYVAAAAVFVAGAIFFGSDLRRAIWPRVTVGHFLLAHYYFQEAVGIFVAMFLTRAAIVWLYHRRQFATAWGSTAMLILVALDFQLVLRTWYPFTNLDARYAPDWPPNAFVLQRTDPLDRLGAAQFQVAGAAHDAELAAFVREPAPADYRDVADRFDRMYYGGFKKPLFEPGFSYFPLTAERSFYGYHESLMPSYFWEFEAALNRGDRRYERGSFIGVWDPHSPLLDVAGIRYLFWHEPVSDPRLIEVGRYPLEGRIYENRRAVPRAYLAPRVELRVSARDALERLQAPSFDPRAAVVTEDRALATEVASDAGSTAGDARITHYEPDRVAIDVRSSGRAVLVLNDMFYPNWSATVNGAAAPIYRVNVVFRGVVVPAGSATVEFRYRNLPFRAGAAVSAVGWATTATMLAFGFRRSRAVAVPARALS